MAEPTIEAAGGVLWRGDPAAPEVALVHRPRYGDWSLPKGKLDPGEHALLGALREIAEETGFTAQPGRRLGSLRYRVPEGPKRVRYWACEAVGGSFTANHEVDELSWLAVAEARDRLTADHDGQVLERFAVDPRRTRALAVVRHASAGDRRHWSGPDADRPLDPAGEDRATTIAALLSAYGVQRAGSADVLRCRATLSPFVRASGVPLDVLPATTAGAFEPDRDDAAEAVLALLDGAGAAAWCGQREVIPDLVAGLCRRLGATVDADDVAEPKKGAVLLLHVAEHRRLVALERLPH